MGQGNFYANSPDFDNPVYTWNWNGGTTEGSLSDQLANGEAHLDATPEDQILGFNGVLLGGQYNGTGMQANTLLHLTATDTDGREISTSATINWHRPLEDQQSLGYSDEAVRYDDTVSDWGTLERDITLTLQPRNISWDIAGAGTGLAAGTSAVLFPQVTLSAEELLGLTTAGYTITAVEPRSTTLTPAFSYQDYKDAVTNEYNIAHNLPGVVNNITTFSSNSHDPNILDDCYSTLAAGPGDDPNYKNSVYQSKFALKWLSHYQNFHSYEFDYHGFKSYNPFSIWEEYQYDKVAEVEVP